MPEKNDSSYKEVSESIKLVFDLTSRIDERVKHLVEQHNEANQRIEKLMERHENILSRLSVLENKNGHGMKEDITELKKDFHAMEIKVAAIEMQTTRHEDKWKTIGDFIFKVTVAVVGAVIVWKLTMKP